MEELIRITFVCVVVSILAVFFRNERPEIALLLAIAACFGITMAASESVRDILAAVDQMIAWSGIGGDIFTPLIKIVGIGLISRVGTELCRDAGQGAMASLVEIGATVAALWLSLPLIRAVWEILRSIL